MNQANFTNPPKRPWIWILIILVVVILTFGGYFLWTRNQNGTPTAAVSSSSEITSQTVGGELDGIESDLDSLDDNFSQLDKIDATQDNTLSL